MDELTDVKISKNYYVDVKVLADVQTQGTMVPYGSTWVSLGDEGVSIEDLEITAYYRVNGDDSQKMRLDWANPFESAYYKKCPAWVKRLIERVHSDIDEAVCIELYEKSYDGWECED